MSREHQMESLCHSAGSVLSICGHRCPAWLATSAVAANRAGHSPTAMACKFCPPLPRTVAAHAEPAHHLPAWRLRSVQVVALWQESRGDGS